jgi:hypothetical protein
MGTRGQPKLSGFNTDPTKLSEATSTLERTLRLAIEEIAGGNPGAVTQLKTAYDGLVILRTINETN